MQSRYFTMLAFAAAVSIPLMCLADPSDQDKQFVKEAASGGMMEVHLGQYASDHGTSDGVKKFGEQMVGDHKKANDELKTVASKESVEVPKKMSDEDKKTLKDLEKLSGTEFDKAYISQMVEDHKKDIAAFEKEASEGSDPEIKAFAQKTLPTLKMHLQMAEALNK